MLTGSYVFSLLRYDWNEGVFYWKVSRSNVRKIGTVAGGPGINGKYWQIRIDGKLYNAHVLAWLLVTGVYPTCKVDHKDGDGLNNRFNNLRLASDTQNAQNTKKRSDNKSGFKGVSWHSQQNKWRAVITINKKNKHLGTFYNIQDAASAYESAAKKYFGDFARTS